MPIEPYLSMMRGVDVVREEFEQHATDDDIAAIDCDVTARIDRAIESEIPRPGTRRLAGREAWAYLTACNAAAERVVLADVGRWSPFKWLWFLRRLPRRVLEGLYATSRPYDLTLAETLSAASDAPPDPPYLIGSVNFEISSATLHAAIRLARGAVYLSNLHRDLRKAAKGVDFEFDTSGPVPRSRETVQQSLAMEIYDRRVEQAIHGQILPGAGTPISSLDHVPNSRGSFVFACHTIADTETAVPFGHQRSLVEITAAYGVQVGTFDKLEALQAKLASLEWKWWRPEAPALLLLSRLLIIILANAEYGLYNLRIAGYLLVDERWLMSHIEPVYEHTCADVRQVFGVQVALPPTARDLIGYLSNLSVTPWPLIPGPPIRYPYKGVCIDPVNLFLRLNAALEMPPSDGTRGNIRADAFEAAVQTEIDKSKWRPSIEIARYRGKHLRVDSRALTDIDAIGENNGVVLIVSCKSVLVGRDYDAGLHAQVRNARDVVEAGIESLRRIIELLSTHPRGDNFDFSAYSRIVGVVCTPSVLFVDSLEATKEVFPGLVAATSFAELSQWLSDGSD